MLCWDTALWKDRFALYDSWCNADYDSIRYTDIWLDNKYIKKTAQGAETCFELCAANDRNVFAVGVWHY